jgi:GT2 family glycosyltransferase
MAAVIVPVYNAAEELARCLEALRATIKDDTEVVVIDDASPDRSVQGLLAAWESKCPSSWRFLANETNRGFVATANRGLLMTGGDVVLLNSDTIPTPGWLQGLERCLASDESIATATPWTNNGEIVSIPRFCQTNPVPDDPAGVARVIARSGPPEYPELPTAVGFCMAISRRAIEHVGVFDEAHFGKGYGEENDFCMRVARVGMRNVLCDDVYVAHVGGRSFGPLGLQPGEDSMRRLLSRHPGYLEIVRAFIENDPLSGRRGEILGALDRAGLRLG